MLQVALKNTLENYVKWKKGNNEEIIWICTVNNHGPYLPVMLIDFGGDSINAFFVNVAISTGSFTINIIFITKTFLQKMNIEPNAFIQDGDSIWNDSTLSVVTCSRMLFSTLQKLNVNDRLYTKFFSSYKIFRAAFNQLPNLQRLVKQNRMRNGTDGRRMNFRFNTAVFSEHLGNELIEMIALYSAPNVFVHVRHYIGTLFDAFRILWNRENLPDEHLEENAREYVQVILKIKFHHKDVLSKFILSQF